VEEMLSVREVVKELVVRPGWVRRLIRDGKLDGHKDPGSNQWVVSRASVDAIKKTKLAEQRARRKRLLEGMDAPSVRPTTKAVQRVRRMVVKDGHLSEEARECFLAALTRYEQHWDTRYQEMVAKRNGKGS